MRRCLTHALFAVAMLTSGAALAQEAKAPCPNGAWFCEEVSPEALPPAEAQPEAEEAAPPAEAAPPERSRGRGHRHPPPRHGAAPPPVVVYAPPTGGPAPQVVIVAPAGQPPPRVVVRTVGAPPPPPVPPPPPPPRRRWQPEWGLNLRLEGIALGGREKGAAEDAGMGGVGLSLRYRPVPSFAFDVGVDVVDGVDYNGDERSEVPFSLSGMLFLNPRSRAQVYLMGGLHMSHAQVEKTTWVASENPEDPPMASVASREYDYFGGQGGIGLEFRLSRRVALNLDALVFIRNRTDDFAESEPEFVDLDTGRTTNTSGGGLFRGGLSFYW